MHSCYPHNTTWSWCPTDTEALWQQNQLTRAQDLARHGWEPHHKIEYRFNAQGFRSVAFDTDTPSIMALGCSITAGIGLQQQDIWCERVSGAMGLPCWNLGQGGGSMDTCFRLAEHWIPRLKPRRVMMLCPRAERIEVIDADGKPGFYTAQDHATPMVAAWLKHPDNCRLNYSKNLKSIQQICKEHSISFHSWPADELYNVKEATGLARDLMHVGAEYHLKFAERVLRKIDAPGVD